MVDEVIVSTPAGPSKVTVMGKRSDPVLLTLHDVGLNHKSCFSKLCDEKTMDPCFRNFCVVHIDIPGQSFDSPKLEVSEITVDKLIEMIELVLHNLKIGEFIGLGVGFGAYLLAAHTIKYKKAEGLILINWSAFATNWSEWGFNSAKNLSAYFTEDYVLKSTLIDRYFSDNTVRELTDLYDKVLDRMNAENLSLLMNAYIWKDDISEELKNIDCDVLIFASSSSPNFQSCLESKSKFNGKSVDLVEMDKFGLLLTEECPKRLLEPIKMFLAGLGYTHH